MSQMDSDQALMPSIVDRLIDPDSGGTLWRRGYGPEQMMDAVRRDLEDLLNTRQSHVGLSRDFVETHHSIVGYGLPDLTSLNAITQQQREEIGRLIEDVVMRFEPRLRDVRATLVDSDADKNRMLRFRVDARLCLDPAPEVAFDTVLELISGHYTVKPSET
jgi:type VI secretion system protein ImpF